MRVSPVYKPQVKGLWMMRRCGEAVLGRLRFRDSSSVGVVPGKTGMKDKTCRRCGRNEKCAGQLALRLKPKIGPPALLPGNPKRAKKQPDAQLAGPHGGNVYKEMPWENERYIR